MKAKILTRMNMILASLMALLGFSCSEYPDPEYGSPHAELHVNGVVTDENDSPLENIKIDVKLDYKGNIYNYTWRDIYTDENGKWNYWTGIDDGEMRVAPDSVLIVANDTANVYAPDSVKYPVVIDKTKGSEWVTGVATAEVDLKLKKK